MRKRIAATGFVLLALAMAVGISSPGLPAQHVAAQMDAFTCPTTGGTFITAITDDPVSLNGIYANDGASVAVFVVHF
jgi:hypothetical protein